jgi:hypothetical protein
MAGVLRKLTVLTLATSLLLVLFASASPQLHAFMHGPVQEHSCAGCGPASQSGEDAPDPGSPEHVCPLTLFASGFLIALAEIRFEFRPQVIAVVEEAVTSRTLERQGTALRARAPPVSPNQIA